MMLEVLLGAASLTTLAVGYFFVELGRERRMESRAHYNAPMPSPSDDKSDDVKAHQIRQAIDAAKGSDVTAKAEWIEEKLEDGWTDDDVTKFLKDRPLLDLN